MNYGGMNMMDGVNRGIQTGSVAASSISAGSRASTNVTFPVAFTGPVYVVAGLNSGSTSASTGQCSVAISGLSSTGFTLTRYNASGSALTFGAYWIAIGTYNA